MLLTLRGNARIYGTVPLPAAGLTALRAPVAFGPRTRAPSSAADDLLTVPLTVGPTYVVTRLGAFIVTEGGGFLVT